MREKTASLGNSMEVLRGETPRDAVDRVAFGAASLVHNASPPAAPPTNGDSEFPLPVEKAYFEQIIENAPEAVSIVDEEHCILRINREFTRLFGFTAAEASGKPLEKLIVPPYAYAVH